MFVYVICLSGRILIEVSSASRGHSKENLGNYIPTVMNISNIFVLLHETMVINTIGGIYEKEIFIEGKITIAGSANPAIVILPLGI